MPIGDYPDDRRLVVLDNPRTLRRYRDGVADLSIETLLRGEVPPAVDSCPLVQTICAGGNVRSYAIDLAAVQPWPRYGFPRLVAKVTPGQMAILQEHDLHVRELSPGEAAELHVLERAALAGAAAGQETFAWR